MFIRCLVAAALSAVAIPCVTAGAAEPARTQSAGPSTVGQGPLCVVIKDVRGDTQHLPGASDQLDIVGGSLSVTATTVTTVVHVAALSSEDLTDPAGRIYEFDFSVGSQTFLTMPSLLPGGSEFDAYVSQQRFEQGKSGARAAIGIGQMTGRLDLRKKDVVLTGPRSMFARHARLGQSVIRHLVAFTYRANGESMSGTPVGRTLDISLAFGLGVDEAWSDASYNPYAHSCHTAILGRL